MKKIPTTSDNRRMTFQVFQGTFKTWDGLFKKAAKFATEIGAENVVSISHSVQGTPPIQTGIVTVWYWTTED